MAQKNEFLIWERRQAVDGMGEEKRLLSSSRNNLILFLKAHNSAKENSSSNKRPIKKTRLGINSSTDFQPASWEQCGRRGLCNNKKYAHQSNTKVWLNKNLKRCRLARTKPVRYTILRLTEDLFYVSSNLSFYYSWMYKITTGSPFPLLLCYHALKG